MNIGTLQPWFGFVSDETWETRAKAIQRLMKALKYKLAALKSEQESSVCAH